MVLESTLIFKIKGIARPLFDLWAGYAKECYCDYLFQAQDKVLSDDLIFAFAKGLEFLCRNENKTKKEIPQWSIETLLKTASSTLNTHWSQEYIYKQSPEYKELCFLKTLIQFLKVDATALKRIEALHKALMKKEFPSTEPKFEQRNNIFDLNQFKKNKKPGAVFKKNIIDYLDSIYYEKHFFIFGAILKNKFKMALADFFKDDEIQSLLDLLAQEEGP